MRISDILEMCLFLVMKEGVYDFQCIISLSSPVQKYGEPLSFPLPVLIGKN